MSPSGEKFAQLCCALASHILGNMPNTLPVLAPVANKSPFTKLYVLDILKGNLLSEIELWTKLTQNCQDQYQDYKEMSR